MLTQHATKSYARYEDVGKILFGLPPTFFVLGYPPLQGALPLETFRELLTLVHEEITNGQAGQ